MMKEYKIAINKYIKSKGEYFIRKYFILLVLGMFTAVPAKAQMADALGTLAIGGAMGVNDAKMIAKGQGSLNDLRFQDDLVRLITDVQMNLSGQNMPIDKSMISFNGFQGIDWNISSQGHETVLEFNHLNARLCLVCKNNEASVNRVKINGGGTCEAEGNTVKMYF